MKNPRPLPLPLHLTNSKLCAGIAATTPRLIFRDRFYDVGLPLGARSTQAASFTYALKYS